MIAVLMTGIGGRWGRRALGSEKRWSLYRRAIRAHLHHPKYPQICDEAQSASRCLGPRRGVYEFAKSELRFDALVLKQLGSAAIQRFCGICMKLMFLLRF